METANIQLLEVRRVRASAESPEIELTSASKASSNTLKGDKIEVNGVELYYCLRGSGPHAILCIPGALAPCEWSFAPQLEHFGGEDSDYTIVTFDPRGYANSRPYHRQYTIEDGQHHLKTDAIDGYHLMKKLGYSKFSVLGWCDGGVTGIFLAALYPTAVAKLVVWGSRTFITERDLRISETLERIDGWNEKFLEAFLPVYGNRSTDLIKVYEGLAESMREFCKLKENGDICKKEMEFISCPTLVMHGGEDGFTAVSHAEHMKRHIRDSKLHIFTTGKHNLQMGKTGPQFNTVVERFLQPQSCINSRL